MTILFHSASLILVFWFCIKMSAGLVSIKNVVVGHHTTPTSAERPTGMTSSTLSWLLLCLGVAIYAAQMTADKIQSYFAICLVVKDERDLVEWIEYHHRMGCDKFYIFDHNS